MNKKQENLCLATFMVLLAISIAFNCAQSSRIQELTKVVTDLQQVQAALEFHSAEPDSIGE